MKMRIAKSIGLVALGAVLAYAVLAAWLIHKGCVVSKTEAAYRHIERNPIDEFSGDIEGAYK